MPSSVRLEVIVQVGVEDRSIHLIPSESLNFSYGWVGVENEINANSAFN